MGVSRYSLTDQHPCFVPTNCRLQHPSCGPAGGPSSSLPGQCLLRPGFQKRPSRSGGFSGSQEDRTSDADHSSLTRISRGTSSPFEGRKAERGLYRRKWRACLAGSYVDSAVSVCRYRTYTASYKCMLGVSASFGLRRHVAMKMSIHIPSP